MEECERKRGMSVKPSQFQAATIEWAIQQLTARDRAARRFLVADEVGLGKTTVAREVIAQFIKDKRPALLREKRNLRVVYLTSNMNVARQNSDRLIEDIDHRSSADRVIADIRNALTKKSVAFTPSYPVELFSWTPSTSIMPQNRRSSRSERLLITYLLCRMYRLPYTQGARLFAMVKDEDKFAFDLRSWKREHSRMPRNIYRIIRDAWSAYTFQYDSQTYELSDLVDLFINGGVVRSPDFDSNQVHAGATIRF